MDLRNFKLGEEVFEKALRTRLPHESFEIVDVRNNSMNLKGLNFLSDVFKVCVTYITNCTSKNIKGMRSLDVIIKIEPTDEAALDIAHRQDIFLTEIRVLRDVLPRVKELVSHQIGPRLLYACQYPTVLIMEDLTRRGFIMKDRQEGISFEHSQLVIKQLAKFHAGSVALYEKYPELIASFSGGIMSSKCPEAFKRLTEVCLLRISESLKMWSDEKYVRAAEKLRKLAETCVASCADAYNYDPDEFCVLNHGDCWINNMMFQENDQGCPQDLILIDYQMAVYTSPVIDLMYFLNTCPENSIKYDKDQFFLAVYLNTLTTTMLKIGCKTKPPSMEQLMAALHKRRIYAVFAGVFLYLRMIANKEDTEDFNEVLIKLGGETRMDVFKNPRAVRAVCKMIPIMDERGYLD